MSAISWCHLVHPDSNPLPMQEEQPTCILTDPASQACLHHFDSKFSGQCSAHAYSPSLKFAEI